MKRNSILLLAIIFLAVVTGCKKDDNDGPTLEDQQKEKLTASWVVSSVSFNDNDVSSDWTGFVLTITTSTSNGYQTANSFNEDVWPLSGTWRFQSTDTQEGLNVIIRDDGTTIDITNVNETTLRLNFTYNEDGGSTSRVKNVNGDWDFQFTKQ